MPRLRAKPHKNRTAMPERGRAIKLGPMESIADLEDALRIMARGLAQLGDYVGASRNVAALLSSKYRSKELELKGLNIRDTEGDQIKLVMTDYLAPFQEEKARADRLEEENAALQAQIDAMGNRPRPPRPSMN